ncbi:MAG: hypothetical protein ABSC03_04150 [Verrucomicrobiota bacterium]|jgi:hypothetical protein
MRNGVWFLAACLAGTTAWSAPVLRVARETAPGTVLLRNGGFEELREARPAGWQPFGAGFRSAPGAGRNGSTAIFCQNETDRTASGASQTVVLARTNTAPLVVRGWSRAEGVTGGTDGDYSLYVDLVYTDDTPLWGQTASFRCGTHDWEYHEFVILPEKPVKSLTLNCLLRGHSGKVWFDDVSVEELRAAEGATLFQGVAVQPAPNSNSPSRKPDERRATQDGLMLGLRDDAVVSLRLDGRELASPSLPGGFLVRDVATNSDFCAFENGACPELGLKLNAQVQAAADHLTVTGRVTDTAGRDRAVTLVFALPLDATGWRWGDDIRRSRVIHGQGEFANVISVRSGATGTMSLYPVGAVWNERAGLALALDMAEPAQFRVGYHASTRQLFMAYDFGLVKEAERFPGGADFRFVIYRFEPRWGFRAAFQKLRTIFPDYFAVRSRDQGLWMPFTDVSTVHGWEDFGFRYHEGNNNVPWDDAHGVLSFRYTEPMTWWMAMKPELPRTPAAAFRVREELAAGANAEQRRFAAASRVAAMSDEAGEPGLIFRNEPWCNGAVWSLNPNPHLPGSPNAATLHWNDATKQQLYGPAATGHLDGEYLDSLEGYVTAELNFRREHFRFTTVPLTFSADTHQPTLLKGLAVFEFTKWFCDDVHRLGKLTFANGVPYRFSFLCPWLDVMGTETDWLRDGRYAPVPVSQTDLWRTMAGGKPYLLLMNTDYDVFGPPMVEKYFQRALFYGMWPGFFSHNASENPYWQNPKWYERDRPRFKEYLPLIKRVAEAGWQPVTQAASDNGAILVERFGPDTAGTLYFTVFNDTAQEQSGTVQCDFKALHLPRSVAAQELITGTPVASVGGGWPVRLAPQDARLFCVTAPGAHPAK